VALLGWQGGRSAPARCLRPPRAVFVLHFARSAASLGAAISRRAWRRAVGGIVSATTANSSGQSVAKVPRAL